MKRASLKTAKVPITTSNTRDVTDRLLKEDELAPSKVKPPRKKLRPQKAVNPASPTADEPLPYIPYHTLPDQSPTSPPGPQPRTLQLTDLSKADKAMANALQQTKAAVEALQIAGRSAPAQYDLAIRYRLDALAHHLEQVAEFVAGRVGK